MKIKPAEYITVLRIIIFIFRGNWTKGGVIQRSQGVSQDDKSGGNQQLSGQFFPDRPKDEKDQDSAWRSFFLRVISLLSIEPDLPNNLFPQELPVLF